MWRGSGEGEGGRRSLHPRRLWSQHAEPPLAGGAGRRRGRGRAVCWPQGHRARPVSLGGLQGPPPTRRGFVCAARLWEGASRGTRWRGKGGIAGALHAQQPAPPAPRRGASTSPGVSWRLGCPPVRDLAPAGRRLRALRSDQPRPRQLQKMAAKAAPVATLPRAGGRAAVLHPAPRPL